MGKVSGSFFQLRANSRTAASGTAGLLSVLCEGFEDGQSIGVLFPAAGQFHYRGTAHVPVFMGRRKDSFVNE